MVSQPLLARGMEVALIETDVEMIRAAGSFGFKVYYGDGTRLDVLRASGAANAEAILVCVDKPEVADRIVEAREKAREANGWIMDVYLLRRK